MTTSSRPRNSRQPSRRLVSLSRRWREVRAMNEESPVEPADVLTRVHIPVDGMTCAACQVRVQRALTRVPGVADASVNLLAHQASVRYDAARVRPDELVAAIRRTGYEARLEAPVVDLVAEQEARDRADAVEYQDLRRKA